jgi:hypothetical protein
VRKEPTGDEEAAPAAQVSFSFSLYRETTSPLRHSTTIRELSNLFTPSPCSFFLLLDKIGPYQMFVSIYVTQNNL